MSKASPKLADILSKIDKLSNEDAHKILVEMSKKFSIQAFIETHDSSYQAWPCPICEEKRYTQEGWEGIYYI